MRDRRCSGFSLIEVMIVVVIIGILAALAYPTLEGYLQRTRQTEAKTNLSALYTAQKIYFATNRQYASSFDDLDVRFETGGDVVYSYTLTATATTFVATATGTLDDDAALDTWTIDQGKTLRNTVNDLTAE